MNRNKKAILVFVLLSPVSNQSLYADHVSGGFDLGQSSAILTESAIPLAQGDWYLSVSHEQVNNKSFSDDTLVGLRAFDIVEHDGEGHADLHSIESVNSTRLNLGYGLTENLTLGLQIPFEERKNIREPEEGHGHGVDPIVVHNVIEHGNSRGIGDATLMGIYRFSSAGNNDTSLLFGLKMPTGVDDQSGFKNEVFVRRIDTGVIPDHHEGEGHHTGNILEVHQQPGSGSWDPIIGIAHSRVLGPVNIDASFTYTIVNEGDQNTDLGDRLQINAGLTYPISQSFDLVAELNGEWRDKEERAGTAIGNSGGSHVYFSPGLRYSGSGWGFAISYGIPAHESINGFQSEPDDRIFGRLSFNF